MGAGAFLWIPLTFALGRRQPFLLASTILLVSIALAGVTKSFFQLLICASMIGLAEAFPLSAVRTLEKRHRSCFTHLIRFY